MPPIRPAMQAISNEPPTVLHLAYTERLNAYMERAVPQESLEAQQRRVSGFERGAYPLSSAPWPRRLQLP